MQEFEGQVGHKTHQPHCPFPWEASPVDETVFKCLLEVVDQWTDAMKHAKMMVIGHKVGSCDEDNPD